MCMLLGFLSLDTVSAYEALFVNALGQTSLWNFLVKISEFGMLTSFFLGLTVGTQLFCCSSSDHRDCAKRVFRRAQKLGIFPEGISLFFPCTSF